MLTQKSKRGVTLIIALGVMSILLILGGGIILTISKSLRMTSNVYNANKAYFAAEASLEDALYELTAHTSGYEKTTTKTPLSNQAEQKYSIVYTYQPNCGDTNDSDWYKIKYKDTYNLDLFNETTTGFDQLRQFKLYVRTPQDPQSTTTPKTRYTLTPETIFLSWTLSGIDNSNPNNKYTLIHNDASSIKGATINTPNRLAIDGTFTGTTQGKQLPNTQLTDPDVSVYNFLNNTSGITPNISKPKLKISSIALLISNTNKPFPLLEFCIEGVTPGTTRLSTPYATITAEGFSAGTKQSIETNLKQDSAISLFDYAVFQ